MIKKIKLKKNAYITLYTYIYIKKKVVNLFDDVRPASSALKNSPFEIRRGVTKSKLISK